MTRTNILRKAQHILLPIVALLVVWQAAATFIADASVLPKPLHTIRLAGALLVTEGPRDYTALYHLQRTLFRVIVASVLGLVLSVTVGITMWRFDTVEQILSDWLPFWMTVPTVIVILVSMILFGFSEMSVVVAVLFASAPFGIVNLWEGMKDVDTELLEMAHTFEATSGQVWRDVYVPHLMPYIFGSYRYILGMVWKIVALAEIFGISNGIGAMFRFYYSQGQIDALLAYLLVFIVVMLTVEYGLLKPLEERNFEWRDAHTA